MCNVVSGCSKPPVESANENSLTLRFVHGSFVLDRSLRPCSDHVRNAIELFQANKRHYECVTGLRWRERR